MILIIPSNSSSGSFEQVALPRAHQAGSEAYEPAGASHAKPSGRPVSELSAAERREALEATQEMLARHSAALNGPPKSDIGDIRDLTRQQLEAARNAVKGGVLRDLPDS